MKTSGILLLIGGLLVLIMGLLVALAGAAFATVGGGLFGIAGAALGVIGGMHVIFGIVLILSGLWCEKKKAWAWIGLIFSIIALVMGGGLYIGPILGIIGAALALKGSPKKGK